MIICTLSLSSHRYINNVTNVEDLLDPIIENLLKTKEYFEFLIGRNGEFDRITASTIRNVTHQKCEDCNAVYVSKSLLD